MQNLDVWISSVSARHKLQELEEEIASLISRYTCRTIGARFYTEWVHRVFATQEDVRDLFLELKKQLDFSHKRSRIIRAVHFLSPDHNPAKNMVQSAANLHRIDSQELSFIYRSLPDEDQYQISRFRMSESDYNATQVANILQQTRSLINYLANKRLVYILSNDSGIGVEDLIGDLTASAIKVIREYEIRPVSENHMLMLVFKGIHNAARNIAEHHGREKRQPVFSVNEPEEYRLVWFYDVYRDRIDRVRAYPDIEHRRVIDGNVLIAAQMEDGGWIAVHHKRLYATEEEALTAQKLRKEGKRSKRSMYLEPAPQTINDFQASLRSIDAPIRSFQGGADEQALGTLHDLLIDEKQDPESAADNCVMRQLICGLPPRSREFAYLVFHFWQDEFFIAWCKENDHDPGSCTPASLGRLIRRYLHITKTSLRNDIANTSQLLWSSDQKKLIAENC